MADLWKSLLLLHLGLSWTVALEAGDCAFVGIYGDKDDFALVLLEDADEQIYLTEELVQSSWRKSPVSKFVEGKDKVKDAKRGTVLRKDDFVTSEASLVAPMAITAFSGSPSSPSILCSIRLNERPGARARMLQELNVVSVQSDTAEYVGATSGTKDELLTEIRDSNNWIDGTAFRKLGGFTVAHNHGGNHSDTMTTSMKPNPNMTMTMTTTPSTSTSTSRKHHHTCTKDGFGQRGCERHLAGSGP
eukprot:s2_g81.t1